MSKENRKFKYKFANWYEFSFKPTLIKLGGIFFIFIGVPFLIGWLDPFYYKFSYKAAIISLLAIVISEIVLSILSKELCTKIKRCSHSRTQ